MEHDITSIVTRLETRTRQLMLQYSTLKQALAETVNRSDSGFVNSQKRSGIAPC